MTEDQLDLLVQASDSLRASRVLHAEGFSGFAASRAYYSMFYVAQAFLEGEGLALSRHSATIAAFGEHFAKTGVVPSEFHRHLIRGMELRQAGDYGGVQSVTAEEAAEQITQAQRFIELAERLIGPIPPHDHTQTDQPS